MVIHWPQIPDVSLGGVGAMIILQLTMAHPSEMSAPQILYTVTDGDSHSNDQLVTLLITFLCHCVRMVLYACRCHQKLMFLMLVILLQN